jgi:hypothetical protein
MLTEMAIFIYTAAFFQSLAVALTDQKARQSHPSNKPPPKESPGGGEEIKLIRRHYHCQYTLNKALSSNVIDFPLARRLIQATPKRT